MDESDKDKKGPSIQSLGGIARREALTPERRSEIASRAAKESWARRAKPMRATHRGSFEQDFGIDVDCYVLDDDQKTAVLSQRGMATALGLAGRSGRALHTFIEGAWLTSSVGPELRAKLANPLLFQWASPNSKVSPSIIHGYDVTILIDVCKAIIQAAKGRKLQPSQERRVAQAQVILNASAKSGIKGLVYALAGYDATKEEVVAAFKLYVSEEAREYEREFPSKLYEEWYRLYKIPKPEKNNPWKFKDLTVKHVYVPLAKSNGKILQLTRAQRAKTEERHKKLHQFLSDIGVKALRTHLGQLLGIAQVSMTRAEYERHVERIFSDQIQLFQATVDGQ
ncbi:P63C domain-containing protein [Myxococcus sp. RHSTA-1-4]|uniref:P63C domain-containing protein n=1 Tax=Myxococcus sp. RHSTA-1-4 TaxID=2874601 RepID=UPI001CBCCADC|nr:P63C domain-containing protein [Myxococcus sp. RHSTA-1-4]MBZ4421759.1 P63C domain-containing protein [Myxococcus sp. RHSTA-1-4]